MRDSRNSFNYVNRQDPIEKELGKKTVKDVLKLPKSIFDDVGPKQRTASQNDLKEHSGINERKKSRGCRES